MGKEKLPPVHITNQRAIKLVHNRASLENRSLGNAAAQTIIESLSPEYKQQRIDAHFGILPQNHEK